MLRVACCAFRVTGYGLRVTGYGFRVASYGLRVTGYGLRVSLCVCSPILWPDILESTEYLNFSQFSHFAILIISTITLEFSALSTEFILNNRINQSTYPPIDNNRRRYCRRLAGCRIAEPWRPYHSVPHDGWHSMLFSGREILR